MVVLTHTHWHSHTHTHTFALASGDINEAKSNAKKHQKQQRRRRAVDPAKVLWLKQTHAHREPTHTYRHTHTTHIHGHAIQMRCEINRIVAISDVSFDFGAVSTVARGRAPWLVTCFFALSWSRFAMIWLCVCLCVSVCFCWFCRASHYG